VIVAAGIALASALAASHGVTVTPAWGGRWIPGSVTGVLIDLGTDDADGSATGVVRDAFQETAFRLRLEAGVERALWLPVRPRADGTISLEARLPDGVLVTTSAAFVASPGPVDVRVGGASSPVGDDEVRISPAELPDLPEAYETVSTLVLDPALAGGLNWGQHQALSEFAARCGGIVLQGWSAGDVAALNLAPGCGGAFLRLGQQETGRESVAAAPRPASGTQVAALLPLTPVQALLDRVGLFLGAYLVVLAGLAWLPDRRLSWSLAAPLAALAAGIALFPQGRAMQHSASWAETDSGATMAVHTSVLETVGGAFGRYRAQVPKAFGFPLALEPGSGVRVSLTDEHPDRFDILVPATLLARNRLRLAGSFAVVPGLRAYERGVIANASGVPASAGLALLGGAIWRLPPLAPGQQWRPGDGDAPVPAGAAARLLADRARNRTAALLPLAATPESSGDVGWLAVFAGGDVEPGS